MPRRPARVVGGGKIREVHLVAIAEEKERGIQTGGVPAQSVHERRRAPRFCCEGMGEVIVLSGALHFMGEVRDLSLSGCRIKTEVAFTLERGTQVEVVLAVDNIRFRLIGGVRSNHKVRGVGLEFMTVSSRSLRHIQELIDELAAKAERETKPQ